MKNFNIFIRPRTEMALFLFAYFGADLAVLLAARLASHESWQLLLQNRELLQERISVKWTVLLAGAVVYGIQRLTSRHPLFQPSYLHWLRATPWTSAFPLPLGPIHLTWRDALLLAALAALARFDLDSNFAAPLIAFGIPYLVIGTGVLFVTCRGAAIPLAYLLGGAILVCHSLQDAIPVFFLIYAVLFVGLNYSLRSFPWKKDDVTAEVLKNMGRKLGWPFDMLPAGTILPRVKITESLACATLAGWWAYCAACVVARSSDFSINDVRPVIIWFGAILLIWRCVIYCGPNRPPLSLFGRIATGRIAIPGYDYVLLAPIASLCGPLLVLSLASQANASPPLALASAVGIGVFIALAAGPSLRHWQLTGQHRIVRFVAPSPAPTPSRRPQLFVKA